MRKKNKCTIFVAGNDIFSFCTGIRIEACIYSKAKKAYTCSWYRGSRCQNKEATNEAATRVVKKLRKKFGTND